MFALATLNRFRRGALRGRAAPAAIVLLALALSFVDASMIGEARAALPLPPRRPPEFTPPAAPSPPEATPPSVSPAQRAPVDVQTEDLQPFNLPPASRQRMRLCGERWRDLKLAGEGRGLTWRSFAEKCLPGKD
jgi:hypothetical protein